MFVPKLFTVFKEGYSKKQFIKDLTAGLIVGVVALPLAIAFAIASGVSPEKGLVTAIIAGFIISAFGGRFATIWVKIPGPHPISKYFPSMSIFFMDDKKLINLTLF